MNWSGSDQWVSINSLKCFYFKLIWAKLKSGVLLMERTGGSRTLCWSSFVFFSICLHVQRLVNETGSTLEPTSPQSRAVPLFSDQQQELLRWQQLVETALLLITFVSQENVSGVIALLISNESLINHVFSLCWPLEISRRKDEMFICIGCWEQTTNGLQHEYHVG